MKTKASHWSELVERLLREQTRRDSMQEEPSSAALLAIVNASLGGAARRAPSTFGPYQLGEKVGEGSTSAIYRVLGTGDEPRVLRRMKLSDPSPKAIDRFTRSLRITLERLEHENILRPLEIGDHEGQPFAILPYLDTLERQLACEEWQPERCARVMLQLAKAVAHAHDRGVIHYDLKPANVLWCPAQDGGEGKPMIIDFDSARPLDPAEHNTTTWEGGGATPAYMAPELLSDGEATVRADIYSLGVIFHEMLTAELPDRARAQHPAHSQRRSRRRQRPPMPRYFEGVCAACLEADPTARYQSAAELVRDLTRLIAGERPHRYRGRLLRALDWASAHRAISAGLWVAATCSAALAWQALDPGPLSAAERSAAAASELAATLGEEFKQLATAAERAATDPAVVRHLDARSPSNLDLALRGHVSAPNARNEFSGLFVMVSDAQIIASYPSVADEVLQRKYPWRDYFMGAMRLGNERAAGPGRAYLGRTFRSETSALLELGFSVPMPETGPTRGILMARLKAQEVLREMQRAAPDEGSWAKARALLRLVLGRAEPLEQVSVLLGPRDRDRAGGEANVPPPERLMYLSHPDMTAQSSEEWLNTAYEKPLLAALGAPAAPGEQFQPSLAGPVLFEDYADPIRESGGWSAAALPILRTGYVVLVQSTQHSPAGDARDQFLGRFAALLIGSGAMLAGLAFVRRKLESLR